MAEVEILTQVITAQYGTLSAGTILRTNTAFAKHLVDDCQAAKYTTTKKAADQNDPETPAAAPDGAAKVSDETSAPKVSKSKK